MLLFFSTGEKKRTILFYKRLSSLAAAIIKFARIQKQPLENMKPVFPTNRHMEVANAVETYFSALPFTDTILVVNSCARGKAVPESDLDFAILVKPGTAPNVIQKMEAQWNEYIGVQFSFQEYKKFTQFSHLHLDIIDANYKPVTIENGEPIDYFEVEIGNQICYSAAMGTEGSYYMELKQRWLPYYDESLRMQRLIAGRQACEYNLDHIPFLVQRGLYFHAFEILYQAFQQYLQVLFIANKTYPIAYNKWIREQIVTILNKPLLYPKLSPILSITDIESNEINSKAMKLRELLNDVANA